MKKIALIAASLLLSAVCASAQEAPGAVDLGLSVQWADEDIAPETVIPSGWRLPTLAEIKELRGWSLPGKTGTASPSSIPWEAARRGTLALRALTGVT